MSRVLCGFAGLALPSLCAYAQAPGPIAQDAPDGSVAGEASTGPDVLVGRLAGEASYGGEEGVSAFSFGFSVCNLGDAPVEYVAFTNEHPIITHNLYRLSDGRFEQIGMSWVFHEFAALAFDSCNAGCLNPGTLQLLGTGCSTPNSASIAGVASILSPRSLIDAHTGDFPYSYSGVCEVCGPLDRRLQVHDSDLDPALNVGALYFVEGQVVAPDDSAAGNQNNNASYRPMSLVQPRCDFNLQTLCDSDLDCTGPGRCANNIAATCLSESDCPGLGRCEINEMDECNVDADCPVAGEACIKCRPDVCEWPPLCSTTLPLDGFCVRLTGQTEREQSGIRAWRVQDPSVVETEIEAPGAGFLILAAKATDLGNGWWRYEYALQNVNLDRSVRSFAIPRPHGAAVDNVGFHDVDYHSGDTVDGTDWPAIVTDASISWSTSAYEVNPDANALRWGTLYNFRFDSRACPGQAIVSLELFKPGAPTSITAATIGPELRSEPVPTVSEWGVAIMILLMLGAGTAIVRRQTGFTRAA